MKRTIFIMIIFSLCILQHSLVSGQSLAMAPNNTQPQFQTYSTSNFANYQGQHKWGRAHTAGFVLVCAGAGVGGIGAILAASAPGNNEIDFFSPGSPQFEAGILLAFTGGVLLCTGTPILIFGTVHDRRYPRLSIVAPKYNEIGLAYHF